MWILPLSEKDNTLIQKEVIKHLFSIVKKQSIFQKKKMIKDIKKPGIWDHYRECRESFCLCTNLPLD